jgi:hypothetical protein
MIRKFVLAFAALAAAAPVHAAEPPKVRAMKDIYGAGFRDCSDRMAEAVAFVHEDDDAYDYLGLWSIKKPNTEMATALTSQAFTDGHGVATVTAVKTPGGACNVSITQALTTPDQTCDALKKDSFKEWKPYAEFNEAELLQDPTSDGSHIVLTPVGKTGCLMVKHIMIHE